MREILFVIILWLLMAIIHHQYLNNQTLTEEILDLQQPITLKDEALFLIEDRQHKIQNDLIRKHKNELNWIIETKNHHRQQRWACEERNLLK